jgi:hypothetical protein
MGKLRLDINSTYVERSSRGHYSIVDIVFNGTTLESAKQLSATVESLEYDVGIDNTSNTLKIAVLNHIGDDANNDGEFTAPTDQTMQAVISALSYSIDDTTYITLLPQAVTTYTMPSGSTAGTVVALTDNVPQFVSYGEAGELAFNSDGIVNSTQISGVKIKVLENGNIQDLIDGKTYDPDGNEVGAP